MILLAIPLKSSRILCLSRSRSLSLALSLSIKPLWGSGDNKEQGQMGCGIKGQRHLAAVPCRQRVARFSENSSAASKRHLRQQQRQQQQPSSSNTRQQQQQQNAKVQSLMRKIRRNLSSPCQRGVISRKLR